MRVTLSILAAVLASGSALAQCPRPLSYEIGGQPWAICSGGINCEAIAHGRHIDFDYAPYLGSPAFKSQVTLDHFVQHMHTEYSGRVWATDGYSIYGIDANNLNYTASIIGKLDMSSSLGYPNFGTIRRLRIRGNFVYALTDFTLYIIDVFNPAAPTLRASLRATGTFVNDVEVVGSYAYVSIDASAATDPSIMVVDISDPFNPVEVRRVGNAGRSGYRIAIAPNMPGFYTLARNNAAGAVEYWNLNDPANPSIQAVNTTLDAYNTDYDDELKVTFNAVSYLDRNNYDTGCKLRFFNSTTLAEYGNGVALPDNVNGLGTDPPFNFVTRASGEVMRINIGDPSNPVTETNYIESPPGAAAQIANIGNGYSILTGDNDLWMFRTGAGAPICISHIGADTGYSFADSPIGLLNDNTLVVREVGAQGSWIVAYTVVTSPNPGLYWQGSFFEPGQVHGLEIGHDVSNNRRVYYTTPNAGYSTYTLHVLNANTLGSMSQFYTMSLTSGVSAPLKFLPANSLYSQPARLVIGGYYGKTQIVSVSGSPANLGVIQAGAVAIAPGLWPNLWLLDYGGILRAFDITSPIVPTLRSTLLMPGDCSDVKTTDLFGSTAAIACNDGTLVRVNMSNASAPYIYQIAEVADGSLSQLAFDGSAIHGAGWANGYEIMPLTFSARPAEDPNFALSRLGKQGIIPICSSSPLTITAHFVAIPAVSTYQWSKYNLTTNNWDALSNGPTASGGTISGATTATLTISGAGTDDGGYFRCQATNSCGTGTSSYVYARVGGYANCDDSTIAPVLNINDFQCFLNRFAQFDYLYANCDGSTASPILNVNDFQCFLNQFATTCQ